MIVGIETNKLKITINQDCNAILVDDLIVRFYLNGSIAEIVVPSGVKSDFASIPRLFWNILPPHRFALSSITHDYLYRVGRIKWLNVKRVDRWTSDELFLAMMMHELEMINKSTLIDSLGIYIRYYGVRAFGWLFFKGIKTWK